ncbi:MAG: hypothetical protein EHM43_08795 [Ignavibacteriae bacterium]|nr:MAG: hypothetical protein EHM43_08795 [Ignavibacteriota bacterium]
MNAARHAISTLLLCTLLTQCVGWVVVFYGVRTQARREVRTRIMSGVPASELRSFVMDRSQIGVDADGRMWEHDGEFSYNNVMYDVVRVVDEADHVVVLAIADLKESHLYQQIALETKKNIPGKAATSPIAKLAAQLLGQPFLRPSSVVHRPSSGVQRPVVCYCSTKDVGRWTSDVEKPPPEGAVASA